MRVTGGLVGAIATLVDDLVVFCSCDEWLGLTLSLWEILDLVEVELKVRSSSVNIFGDKSISLNRTEQEMVSFSLGSELQWVTYSES
jgi:hypothetical protein